MVTAFPAVETCPCRCRRAWCRGPIPTVAVPPGSPSPDDCDWPLTRLSSAWICVFFPSSIGPPVVDDKTHAKSAGCSSHLCIWTGQEPASVFGRNRHSPPDPCGLGERPLRAEAGLHKSANFDALAGATPAVISGTSAMAALRTRQPLASFRSRSVAAIWRFPDLVHARNRHSARSAIHDRRRHDLSRVTTLGIAFGARRADENVVSVLCKSEIRSKH